jgi:hypothetical protein
MRTGHDAMSRSCNRSCLLVVPLSKMVKLCSRCNQNKAVLRRPKNLDQVCNLPWLSSFFSWYPTILFMTQLCKSCFFSAFEEEVHETILKNNLFKSGERIAIGASGGKDSTVLGHVMVTLNERYRYRLHHSWHTPCIASNHVLTSLTWHLRVADTSKSC